MQKLDKITYRISFINVLEKKFKPSSVLLFHTILKIAINAAVEDEILDRNRFTKIPLKGVEEPEEVINYYTHNQLVTFLEATNRLENVTNSNLFLTLTYTGLRRGEAFGLQWKNIDFNKKTITVERTRDRHSTRTPKTVIEQF
nr:tyrosine-type recombinase/integrase [Psychrobacillus glaciei]